MNKLKSCPFCGNNDIQISYKEMKNFQGFNVWCYKCNTEQYTFVDDSYKYEGKIEAINLWNTRTTERKEKTDTTKTLNDVTWHQCKCQDDGIMDNAIYEKPIILNDLKTNNNMGNK